MSHGMSNITVQSILQSLTPEMTGQKAVVAPELLQLPTIAEQKRCGCCRKKLTIVDFTCDKCQSRFCSLHRLPEVHICKHDYRKDAVKLERVVADKLERI